MTTSRIAAASILLALLLAGGLAGCAPTGPADSGDTGVNDSSETQSETETETDSDGGGFAGVTVAGTGDYALPADMPIGGYEFADADTQPDGCTWTIYVGDSVLAENNGALVFVTDVTTRFVTDGCPDWVQFE